MNDSFTDTVEETLRGKYVRVHSDVGVFEGWADRIAPERGSIVLHDATNTTVEESIGSVFLHTCAAVEVLRPAKRVEFCAISDLNPYPDYDPDARPTPETIRRAYRNQFPGEFPVVRENGTILTGHEYVAAADVAGLERIPVEMVAVSDTQAAELFRLAHDDESADDPDASERTSDDGDASDDEDESDDGDDEGSSSVYGYGY
jgi:ParB family chromosome partitioning protein